MCLQNALRWTAATYRIPRLILVPGLAALLLAGCGSGPMSGGQPPNPPGNSTVPLLLTSTANDQLTSFGIDIESVELTDSNGNSVPLYSNTNLYKNSEFMHLNGAVEPLATATVPQGTYTSATVTTFGCSFTTLGISAASGGLQISTYAQGLCGQGTGATTVNLRQPIVVSGSSIVLALDLQVGQSYTLTSPAPSAAYTISPVFTLRSVAVAAQPTNELNGKIIGLSGRVTSIDQTKNTIEIEAADGATVTAGINASTIYQGASDLGSLSTGVVANLDIVIQPDGSFEATRIEVDDPNEPSLILGPWLSSDNGGQPEVWTMQPVELLDCTVGAPPVCGGVFHNTNSTVFAVSQQFSNVASLPFPAAFTSSAAFAGQNLGAYIGLTFDNNSGEAVTTQMLEPQAIDGTVLAMSTQNGFSVYTVRLASYDPIVTLESAAPVPPLINPSTMLVYADSNTQLLNSMPVQSGSVVRFRGVIFNDNGTMRMDCSEILDGVAE